MTAADPADRMARATALLAEIGATDTDGDEQLERMLAQGCDLFGVDIGIVSHIVGDDYTVKYVHDPSGAISRGDRFAFPGTFCAITYEADHALGIQDVEASPYSAHPCIETGLRAYIGVPIVLLGERYGTMNFSSPSPRDRTFEQADLKLAELLGTWTESLLLRMGHAEA